MTKKFLQFCQLFVNIIDNCDKVIRTVSYSSKSLIKLSPDLLTISIGIETFLGASFIWDM